MQKRHFELVASVIAAQVASRPNVGGHTFDHDYASAFADAFEAENPRFDRALFLKACGVN